MDNNNIYSQVVDYIYTKVSAATFNAFIKTLKLRDIQSSPYIAYLETKDNFFVSVISTRYLHFIEEGFKHVTGHNFRVIIKSTEDYNNFPLPISNTDNNTFINKNNLDHNFSSRQNTGNFVENTMTAHNDVNNNISSDNSSQMNVFSNISSNFFQPTERKEKNPEPPAIRKPVISDILTISDYTKEKIFNPKYTFKNFVVGNSNKYAHAACMAVANSPSDVYNPLFIYGKSGLGKTHLMNAIGIHLLETRDNFKILYVSSETFTNDFIKSLQDAKTQEFKNKYRNADVLLIDDIQFLEGKETIQEEFFHTFNALHSDRKQIIISSDRPPNKLTELDERLRSRFGANMMASLQPPDYETRVAILMKKAENQGIEVDDDMYQIICLISEKIKDNIRELEGAFLRITSFAQIMHEKADLPFAKRILKDIMNNSRTSITPEKIKNAVCNYYKITIDEMESKEKKSRVAFPRQIAMYLCRTMTDYSFPKIGVIFGNKHYTTVKHAYDKIADDLKYDNQLKHVIDTLTELINKG